jgi:AAA+ superfamily predicted ATPase
MFNNEMIYSMVIATTITGLISSIANNIPYITKNLWFYIKKLYSYFFGLSENKVEIVGTIFKNGYGVSTKFPPEYNAVMSTIIKKKINLGNITYINDNTSTFWRDNNDDNDFDFKKYKFYANPDHKICIDKNICISFYSYEEEKGKDNAYSTKYLVIVISSKKYSTQELQEIIATWTKEYKAENKLYKDDGNIYYYSLDNVSNNKTSDSSNKKDSNKNKNDDVDDAESNSKKWSKNMLTTFKTFDNIFFKDKNVLIKKLNYFLNNENKYKKKGIPYNFGLLFYGDPGCGKTSCIKAISNYTKRHVVEINLKQIETCGDFINIFRNNTMNDNYVPHNKKIIVLEDIDCMIDIVKSRDSKENGNNNPNEKSDHSESNGMGKLLDVLLDKKDDKFKKDDKLTLSCILNTIDGILENYGRILIITTNYVDQLDKALIRPGRIDMKVNFTRATSEMCYHIVENFFEQDLSKDIDFIDQKYTPAEILEICSLHQDNIDEAITQLTTN